MSNNDILNPIKATKLLGVKINDLLSGQTYKLRRVGSNPTKPIDIDNNVLRGILRYDCLFELKTNMIYKR